jgi:hypothetical protein
MPSTMPYGTHLVRYIFSLERKNHNVDQTIKRIKLKACWRKPFLKFVQAVEIDLASGNRNGIALKGTGTLQFHLGCEYFK